MFTSAQQLAIVRTEIDTVFFEKFTTNDLPSGFVDCTFPIFNQITTDKGFQISMVNRGVDYFAATDETQSIKTATPRVSNKVTTQVVTFTQSIIVSKQLFDDNMHNVWANDVADLARKARLSMNRAAFGIFRGAFSSTLTADGVSLINASHPLIGGGTTSNLITTADIVGSPTTTALTSNALEAAITRLVEQVDQSGTIVGNAPRYLVVPPRLFRTAVQLTNSVLEGDTSSNAINVYRSEMGIIVVSSNFLGSAAGGSNTAWFLMASEHSVNRIVRQGLQTHLRDWGESDNLSYRYQANYREAYEALTHAGIVGATGL